MKIINEHIDFQRGLDPKKAMGIGFFKFEVEYSGSFEEIVAIDEDFARKWTYNDQRILEVEGSVGDDHISMWIKLSDGKEFSFEANLMRQGGFAYITIPSENIKDQDIKEEFLKFLSEEFSAIQPVLSTYEKILEDIEAEKEWQRQIAEEEEEEEELDESQNFERGMDPKDSMGIGNELYRENLQALNITKYSFPWIEDNTEIYASRLTDLGVKLGSISQKTSNFFVFNWLNSRGGMQLRTINLPKENWVNLFAAVTGFIRDIETIKEALNFERGKDPKASMNIGIPTWETLQEDDVLKVPKKIPLNNNNVISPVSAVADLPAGAVLEVQELDNASTKEWTLWYRYFANMDDYKEGDHVSKERLGYITGTPGQFKKMFQFLPRGVNEAQEFQRGQDPKSSMNIGKKVLIENWLKENNLFEDSVINKDLTIDIPAKANLAVHLNKKGWEGFPEFIQFRKVYGGFDISDNKFTSLKGCPTHVYETDNLKGSFKCFNNNLSSLEGSPKRVDGVYICYGNPGKFQRKDVNAVCRVKSKQVWGDDRMKVNESMEFQRGEDPMGTMDIGFHAQIKTWFKSAGVSDDLLDDHEHYVEYRINKDGTIDVLDDINLVGAHVENFPYFIRFNRIYGSFYVANNKFTNLDGFPKEVDGDLSIYSSEPGAKKWKESDIRKKVKVKGNIWN